MTNYNEPIEVILRSVVDQFVYTPGQKSSEAILAPAISAAIRQAGYLVDEKDSRGILPSGVPVWRYPEGIEQTTLRRKIDIVVYDGDTVAALIESEDDIADVRFDGKHARYFVQSLAMSMSGNSFSSYKSVERMAVAAYGLATGFENILNRLSNLQSDELEKHNPKKIPMFVVLACGWGRARTRERAALLEARLKTLGTRIITGS